MDNCSILLDGNVLLHQLKYFFPKSSIPLAMLKQEIVSLPKT